MKSLLAQSNRLADSAYQLKVISGYNRKVRSLQRFEDKLRNAELEAVVAEQQRAEYEG